MSPKPAVAVVTDSTCDLEKHVAEELGIVVVPLNVHFGEDVYQDQIDISTDDFMEKMAQATNLPTTSQPSIGAFEDAYRDLKAQGFTEIFCVTIGSKLSGTFQSASIAAQNVANEIKVEVLDSATCSYALGFMALRAAEVASKGLGASEISETLRNELNRYHIVFFVDTLEHLRRGGRIGKAAQMVGTVLQLKPLLRVDEGQIVPFERTRTRSKAIKALEQYVADIGSADEVTVLYNTTPEDAATLANNLRSATPEKEPKQVKISPVIATHVGPGLLGVAIKESLSE